MSKFKNLKIEFKHLLTAVAALGMTAGFIAALFSKKKATACVAFFASLAGLAAGIGMEAGLVKEPDCCRKIEVEIGGDDDDDWSLWEDDDEEPVVETEEEPASDEETEEPAKQTGTEE